MIRMILSRSAGAALLSALIAGTLAPSADAADGAAHARFDCGAPDKVCRYEETRLPVRVLTRVFARTYDTPEENEAGLVQSNVPGFQRYFVFETRDLDWSNPLEPRGWYRIGPAPRGTADQWIRAADTVEWRHALVAAFRHPGTGTDRRPAVLFFDTEEALQEAASDDELARLESLRRLHALLGAGGIPEALAGAGVVSAEPGPFVDIDEQFYLMPIIDWTHLGRRMRANLEEERHLRIVAVTQERVESTRSAEARVPKAVSVFDGRDGTALVTRGAGGMDLLDLNIAFVIDMTGSMEPWLIATLDRVRKIALRLNGGPTQVEDRLKFALVGYRDNPERHPEVGYASKIYTEGDGFVDIDGLLDGLQAAQRDFTAYKAGRGPDVNDWPEDIAAGIDRAIGLKGGNGTPTVFFVVGDASALKGHESQAGMKPETAREKLDGRNIGVASLYIVPTREDAQDDIPVAAAHFRALASNEAVSGNAEPLLFEIDSRDTSDYDDALDEMLTAMVHLLDTAHTQLGSGGPVIAADDPQGGTNTVQTTGQRVVAAVPSSQRTTGQGTATTIRSTGGLDRSAAAESLVSGIAMPYFTAGLATPQPDFTAWTSDRDLVDPSRRALDVRILLTRTELNDLIYATEGVLDALRDAQLGTAEFFDALQSIVILAAKNEPVSLDRAMRLKETGLAPTWLASLPYTSAVLEMNSRMVDNFTDNEFTKMIEDIDQKATLYRSLLSDTTGWIKLNPNDAEDERVKPLRIESLP